MLGKLVESWTVWWATVTPEFAMLLALPFGVAVAGMAADAVRRSCGRR